MSRLAGKEETRAVSRLSTTQTLRHGTKRLTFAYHVDTSGPNPMKLRPHLEKERLNQPGASSTAAMEKTRLESMISIVRGDLGGPGKPMGGQACCVPHRSIERPCHG
jgi:hypothetical protein